MKRHAWKIIAGVNFVLVLIFLFSFLGAREETDVYRKAVQGNEGRIALLQREVADLKTNFGQPRDFPGVEHFKMWVDLQNLPLLGPADWDRARTIQSAAFRQGYNVFYQLVLSSVTQKTEFWPVTRIGQEVWTIEPQTNQVTKFYPREWWR